jgi:hypothetical protein
MNTDEIEKEDEFHWAGKDFQDYFYCYPFPPLCGTGC